MQRQTRNGSPATLPAAAAAKRSHASETTEGPCCPVSRESRPSRKASRGSGREYCTAVARHGRRFERFYASGDGAIGCGGRLLAFRCRHGFGCLWKSSRLGGRCDGPRSPPVYNLSSYRWGGCIIACTARVVWLFCEGGWTRGWHVDAEEGERGSCATAGWLWVGGTCGMVGIVLRRVARRSWEDVSCVCPVDYGRGN